MPAEVFGIYGAAAGAEALYSGMSLAWILMAVMVSALAAAGVMLWRAYQGSPLPALRGWLDLLIPILSVIGLGISIYLTYVEGAQAQAVCGPIGDCNAVQSSPYAKLWGVVPVGLIGALGYIAILAAWFWKRFRQDALAKVAGPAMFAMTLFGVLFSIYLTYLEIFAINAVCIWCLSSALLMVLLMLLNLPAVTIWLAAEEEA